jgi:hypothetical protein
MTPGVASFKADIKLDGEILTGVINLQQSSTLAAETPMLRDDRLAAALQKSLRGVDELSATIQLAGTLRKPDFRIESNVGPQLAAGIQGAMKEYLTEQKDRLVTKLQRQVDEQVAELDARRQEAQQELLAKLGEDQQFFAQLASVMGGKPSLEAISMPKIGQSLSLDRFKR